AGASEWDAVSGAVEEARPPPVSKNSQLPTTSSEHLHHASGQLAPGAARRSVRDQNPPTGAGSPAGCDVPESVGSGSVDRLVTKVWLAASVPGRVGGSSGSLTHHAAGHAGRDWE